MNRLATTIKPGAVQPVGRLTKYYEVTQPSATSQQVADRLDLLLEGLLLVAALIDLEDRVDAGDA